MRDETLSLHDDTIRGLQIFDDECRPASQDTRVVATDMRLGQTEKTRRMTSEHRFVGKRHLLPAVESLEHF